jgi:hypothetical protein
MSAKWQVLVQPSKRVAPNGSKVIEVLGLKYAVDFSNLPVGASFVIPTVASASQVAKALAPAASFYTLELVCEEITWFDMAAVRVHHISSRASALPLLLRRG